MNSYKAGLAQPLPPVEMLEGPHGPLAFRAYPAKEPWLRLLISHGFGEHLGWYDHVAQSFRDAGISAYIFDQYHHGRSWGRSADVPDFSVLVDGLQAALNLGVTARPDEGQLPLVLLGHSNGALVALHALHSLPGDSFSAVVLSSPFLDFPAVTRRCGLPLLRLLGRFAPQTMLPTGGNPEFLTTDASIWRENTADPLRFRRVSVRMVLAMASATAAARRWNSCHGLPLLLLSGDQEQVVDPVAAQRWLGRLRTPDRKATTYPGLRHELFNAPSWQTVLDDIVSWLEARFPR
jgi:lysophospholipase